MKAPKNLVPLETRDLSTWVGRRVWLPLAEVEGVPIWRRKDLPEGHTDRGWLDETDSTVSVGTVRNYSIQGGLRAMVQVERGGPEGPSSTRWALPGFSHYAPDQLWVDAMPSIYLASSWRNLIYPSVLAWLREAGHEVYDFRAEDSAFSWATLDPAWQQWTPSEFVAALQQPEAQRGFHRDHQAMEQSEVLVLLLPCGRSAHLELGWACGRGKRTAILMPYPALEEPELMYLEADAICLEIEGLLTWLAGVRS